MKLLRCDLLEKAVLLGSGIWTELPQAHLLRKLTAQGAEGTLPLLLAMLPNNVEGATNRNSTFHLTDDNRFTVHSASIDPAKMTGPAAMVAFVGAMVDTHHGGMVTSRLPMPHWRRNVWDCRKLGTTAVGDQERTDRKRTSKEAW